MSSSFTVSSDTLRLTLDGRGRAVSLVHRASKHELLSAPTGLTGLWSLGLIRPVRYDDPLPAIREPGVKYEGHEWWINRNEYRSDLEVDADDAGVRVVVEKRAGPEGPGLGGVGVEWRVGVEGGEVVVRAEIAANSKRIEMRFSVELPEGWAIKRATFPRLRGFGTPGVPGTPGSPQEDALLYPENWGVLRRNPLADMTAYTGQYPSAANWAQMAAWLHGDIGVYLGVLDGESNHTGIDAQYVEGDRPAPWNTERWHVERADPGPTSATPLEQRIAAGARPAFQFRVNHWPVMSRRWECGYPIVLEGFEGGWYEAALIHKRWALRQRWCRRGRLADRADVSESLRGLDLWFSKYGFAPWSLEPAPAWDFRDAMKRLHEFFGMPFGVHWYHWHAFSWHRNFPAHAPVVEGFDEVKSELQDRGIVIMPYCQGRLLYRERPAFQEERAHASIEANGQPYMEMYTPEDDFPLALCMTDDWSRGQLHEAARSLWRTHGTEGVYFDQITAMPPSLCYHAGHGHELGGGSHYWRGYDETLGSMAWMIEEDHDRFLSSELMADAFLDRIDLYLAFVPPLEDYVPLFSAIYGGYTFVMGRATPTDAMKDPQLFAMMHGEQALFGGQVGWMNDEILKHPAAATYLRDVARLRGTVRTYLQEGEMERPLEEIGGPGLTIDLPPSLTAKPRPVRVERGAVRGVVWRRQDGRRLVMLLNRANERAEVTIPPRAGWAIGWTMRRLGNADQTQRVDWSEPLRVSLAPREIVAVESD